VRPRYERNKDDLTMGLTFVIAEAPRVYVESIDINGNTLTQDKVIRREFRIAEGDAFNSLQVKRSTNRINSLGYFQEKFEIEQKPGSRPTGSCWKPMSRKSRPANCSCRPVSPASKASSSRLGPQRNFRGRGQTVGLSGSYSRYSPRASSQLHRTLPVRQERVGRCRHLPPRLSQLPLLDERSQPHLSAGDHRLPAARGPAADRISDRGCALHAQLRRHHARPGPVLRF
jgi:hypothetical protein